MQDAGQRGGQQRKRGRPTKFGIAQTGAWRQRESVRRKEDDTRLLAAKLAGILTSHPEVAAAGWYDADLIRIMRRVLSPEMVRWLDDLDEKSSLTKSDAGQGLP